jgi:hypothetical protein
MLSAPSPPPTAQSGPTLTTFPSSEPGTGPCSRRTRELHVRSKEHGAEQRLLRRGNYCCELKKSLADRHVIKHDDDTPQAPVCLPRRLVAQPCRKWPPAPRRRQDCCRAYAGARRSVTNGLSKKVGSERLTAYREVSRTTHRTICEGVELVQLHPANKFGGLRLQQPSLTTIRSNAQMTKDRGGEVDDRGGLGPYGPLRKASALNEQEWHLLIAA